MVCAFECVCNYVVVSLCVVCYVVRDACRVLCAAYCVLCVTYLRTNCIHALLVVFRAFDHRMRSFGGVRSARRVRGVLYMLYVVCFGLWMECCFLHVAYFVLRAICYVLLIS